VTIDPRPWMPKAMPDNEKSTYAALWPHDPHRAAAEAWEAWAAQIEPEPGVIHASTGQQSVTYAEARSAFKQAESRARWHRARTRPYSVPTYSMGTPAPGGDDE
jgi:glutathione S-transferase